jgi:hypothetical protein
MSSKNFHKIKEIIKRANEDIIQISREEEKSEKDCVVQISQVAFKLAEWKEPKRKADLKLVINEDSEIKESNESIESIESLESGGENEK